MGVDGWCSLLAGVSSGQSVESELWKINDDHGWLGLVNLLALTDEESTGLKSKQNIIHNMAVVGHGEGVSSSIKILKSSFSIDLTVTDPDPVSVTFDDTFILTCESDSEKVFAFVRWLSQSNQDPSVRQLLFTNLVRVMADEHAFCELLLQSLFSFPDAKNRTPLHLSSWNGQLAVTQLLASVVSDLNAEEVTGHTALFFACYKNREQIVRTLVSNGAGLTGKANPLNYVCSLPAANHDCSDRLDCYAQPGVLPIIKVLVGADPTCIPSIVEDFTADESELVIRWMHSQSDSCSTCLKFKSVTMECRQHLSKCHYPTSDGTGAILPRHVLAVISSKYRINVKDTFGHTSLMTAVCNKRRCTMRMLLALGADGNLQNMRDDTILHMAINGGLKDYVDDILKMNKPLVATNRKWETPADVANNDVLVSITKEGDGGFKPADCAQHNQQDDIIALLSHEHPELISPLSDAPYCYRCTLCTEMLVLPSQLPCGHRFCLPCITKTFHHELKQNNETVKTSCPYRCLQKSITSPTLDQDYELLMMSEIPKDYNARLQSYYRTKAADIIQEIRKTYEVVDDQVVYASCQFSVGGVNFTISPTQRRELLRISCPLLPLALLKSLSRCKRRKVLTYILEANLLGAKVCGGTVEVGYEHLVLVTHISLQLCSTLAASEMITAMKNCYDEYQKSLRVMIEDTQQEPTMHQGEIPSPTKISVIRSNHAKAALMVDTLQIMLQKIGIIDNSIYYDNRSNWHIKLATVVVSVTYESSYDMLYVYMPIVSILPSNTDQRNAMFEVLLTPQREAAGLPAGIGFDSNANFVLFHMAFRVGCVPHTTLRDMFLEFVEASFCKIRQVQGHSQIHHQGILDPCNKEVCSFIATRILRQESPTTGCSEGEISSFMKSGMSIIILIFDSEDSVSYPNTHTMLIRENPFGLFKALCELARRKGFTTLLLRLPTSRSAVLLDGVASETILIDDDSRLPICRIKSFLESLCSLGVRAVLIDG
eukprot:TRINITY_DN2412_c0_g1_i1.p1 TRINITY_DN2412_c0_g1~~TRINITY_DN2412_c0_g1_i1.p1  ORF type:complete len:997 (+),score=145.95 TRINITY_DN2412_c0_g1_i1:124-3114(+)